MNIVSLTIVLTSIVSVAGWLSPRLVETFIGFPYGIKRHREWHRLLTPGFLHADMFHLYFNMYGLASFGGSDWGGSMHYGSLLHFLEHRAYLYPTELFLLCYVGGMVVANVITYQLHGDDPGYRHLGASAGVCAVMSAGILINPFSKIFMLYIPFPIPGLFFLLFFLLSSFLYRHSHTQVSHLAHLVGCLYGIGFITYLEPQWVANSMSAFGRQFF